MPIGTQIPCLFFADDRLFFCQGKFHSFQLLKKLMHDFCAISGQTINFNNSSMIFSLDISRSDKTIAQGVFHIPLKRILGKVSWLSNN